MIKLWGYEVTSETCEAIGDFSIAWAQFERTFFEQGYNYNKAESIIVHELDTIDVSKIESIRNLLLDYAQKEFGEINNFICKLYIREREAAVYNDAIEKFLSDQFEYMSLDESVKACIYISNRFRNNMLHGSKDIRKLNNQIKIFQELKDFLISLIKNFNIQVEEQKSDDNKKEKQIGS